MFRQTHAGLLYFIIKYLIYSNESDNTYTQFHGIAICAGVSSGINIYMNENIIFARLSVRMNQRMFLLVREFGIFTDFRLKKKKKLYFVH